MDLHWYSHLKEGLGTLKVPSCCTGGIVQVYVGLQRHKETATNPAFISKSVGEEGQAKIKQCLHNCGFSGSS